MSVLNWVAGLLGRLRRETQGNVAMIFALSLPALILMTVGGVDIHRVSTVRVNLQDALDAATLAAARSSYTSNTDIQRVGLAALQANLAAYPDVTLLTANTTFTLNSDQIVVANARANVKTLVANIFLPPYGQFMDDYLPVGAHSEVNRSAKDIEVSLVLDITGSMQGQKLTDLKEAAKDLVDLVVQPVQTPYYSKVALVPYSHGVNPGTYLTSARGSVIGSTNITGAVINLTGSPKTITAATKARPVVITATAHGFSNDDVVWISGVSGMTQLNNKPYLVKNKTNDTFELYTLSGSRVDGRNYSTHSGSSGRVQKCQNNDCSITITSNSHGLSNNDYVYITNVGGMTQINDQSHLVGNVTANTYTIDLISSSLSPYSSGGKSWCAQPGCTYYAFENEDGDLTTHMISSCVTERTGAQAYTDAAPTSSARVGRHYPGISGSCLGSTIEPLSSNIADIKADIDALSTNGSTAGQIGIAWGWYMVSPNFGTLWPSAAGAPYSTTETLKAVVIMTDGEFNAPYCNGVTARYYNAASSASNNCDPDNGEPYAQSRALCDGMKLQGIVVYTVGFQIPVGSSADDLMSDCATSSSGYFNASSGQDLASAFAAIGRDITRLRISK